MNKLFQQILSLFPPMKRLLIRNKQLAAENNELKSYFNFVPPGHYYSPIPSRDDILSSKNCPPGLKYYKFKKSFKTYPLPSSISAIDINSKEQLRLIDKFDKYYQELPFKAKKTKGLRYYFENQSYEYADAIFLYFMIRHIKPKTIIEVGSGYSSCVVLDTNERFFKNKIHHISIEPYPELLNSLIKKSDQSLIEIRSSRLQDTSLDTFKQLQENDILFIDSTHVSKVNSDVNYIIHEILPVLNKGVYIHFHDIYYPFEYPKERMLKGMVWNEQYILRSFLEFNSHFKIVLFTTYLENLYREKLCKKFPLIYKNTGASLWLKKVA